MRYLAITQKTCDWLLRTITARDAFISELPKLISTKALKDGLLAIGAIRICASGPNTLLLWNNDYTSASGVEEWGFILLSRPHGILNQPDILSEVFERCLFVINQRLQGLLLPDDRFIHRALGDKIHSCLAGRGNAARQNSLGYVEGVYSYGDINTRSILIVGPWGGNIDGIKAAVKSEIPHIEGLLNTTNDTLVNVGLRPAIDNMAFIGLRDIFLPKSAILDHSKDNMPVLEVPELDATKIAQDKIYETLNWTYEDWIERGSPLSLVQRSILENDIILSQPLRLIGAAGSGKTLLMQLLCIRRLEEAKSQNKEVRILYVVHNNEMAETVIKRFTTLGKKEYLEKNVKQNLVVSTLFGYSQMRLSLPDTAVIDRDAYQTKLFQRSLIKDCIKIVAEREKSKIGGSVFLSSLVDRYETQDVYADLIGAEIGVSIKGRNIGSDSRKYIDSEKPLSRFHGALSQNERSFVFDIYLEYHMQLFETYETLDSDDVALSLLGHFRTPLWEMRRKKEGFDFVFVDETQLFNENERSLFHLLTKEDRDQLPIALALDEAQALHGATTSGFGVLGIENLSNQTLNSVHRCTSSILSLAFYILQKTTDLFTIDFPDFTQETVTVVPDDHPLAMKPRLSTIATQSLSKALLREIRELRKRNVRQIAVIIHSEKYWSEIEEYFLDPERQLSVMVQSKRGEIISSDKPIIVLTRPETVGGQEFDAVLAVGIEKGLVPPIVTNHAGLQTVVEQQSLRELYLSFTRARYILMIVNTPNSLPSPILKNAIRNKLIES